MRYTCFSAPNRVAVRLCGKPRDFCPLNMSQVCFVDPWEHWLCHQLNVSVTQKIGYPTATRVSRLGARGERRLRLILGLSFSYPHLTG